METVRFYKMRNLIILITLSLLALLCVYMDEASRANKKVMYVLSHDNGKESLLFDDFSEALPPVFDKVFTMQEGLMRAMKNGYSVIVTDKGKILPGEYLRIKEFKEDLSSVKSKDNKYGFIDRNGKIVIPLEYEDAGNFSEGLAPVKKDGKWGYISKSGEVRIPFEFDKASEFSEEYAVVSKNGEAGFIDKNGVSPTGFVFDSAKPFRYGIAVVKNGDENQVINKKWETIYVSKSSISPFPVGENVLSLRAFVLPPLVNNDKVILRESDADRVYPKFENSLLVFEKNRKFGAVNTNGNIVAPANFDSVIILKHGYLLVREGSKKGLISKSGKYILEIKPEYYDIRVLDSGKIVALEGDTLKIISDDLKTETVVSDINMILGVRDGKIIVQKSGKKVVLDENGAISVEAPVGKDPVEEEKDNPSKISVYGRTCGFVDGLARVEQSGNILYIDESGNIVLRGKWLRRVDWKDVYACGRRGDFGYW